MFIKLGMSNSQEVTNIPMQMKKALMLLSIELIGVTFIVGSFLIKSRVVIKINRRKMI
jgi:hypothetical protein